MLIKITGDVEYFANMNKEVIDIDFDNKSYLASLSNKLCPDNYSSLLIFVNNIHYITENIGALLSVYVDNSTGNEFKLRYMKEIIKDLDNGNSRGRIVINCNRDVKIITDTGVYSFTITVTAPKLPVTITTRGSVNGIQESFFVETKFTIEKSPAYFKMNCTIEYLFSHIYGILSSINDSNSDKDSVHFYEDEDNIHRLLQLINSIIDFPNKKDHIMNFFINDNPIIIKVTNTIFVGDKINFDKQIEKTLSKIVKLDKSPCFNLSDSTLESQAEIQEESKRLANMFKPVIQNSDIYKKIDRDEEITDSDVESVNNSMRDTYEQINNNLNENILTFIEKLLDESLDDNE